MSLAVYFCLNEEVNTLTLRQKKIFACRYGLGVNLRPETLATIGKKFNISRERVRQILTNINRKIKARVNLEESGKLPKTEYYSLRVELLTKLKVIEESKDRFRLLTELFDEYLPDVYYPAALDLIQAFAFENEEKTAIEPSRSDLSKCFNLECREYKSDIRLNRLFDSYLSFSCGYNENKELKYKKPAREIFDSDISGNFESKKLSRLVSYESNLEKKFLLDLEKARCVKSYTEQPFSIPYVDVHGASRNYYPDVLVQLKNYYQVLVEIKPIYHMAIYRNILKMRAARCYCAENKLGYIMTEGSYDKSIDFLIDRDRESKEWEDEALSYLNHNKCISYIDLRNKFLRPFDITFKDIVPFIIKNSLKLNHRPFRIEKCEL